MRPNDVAGRTSWRYIVHDHVPFCTRSVATCITQTNRHRATSWPAVHLECRTCSCLWPLTAYSRLQKCMKGYGTNRGRREGELLAKGHSYKKQGSGKRLLHGAAAMRAVQQAAHHPCWPATLGQQFVLADPAQRAAAAVAAQPHRAQYQPGVGVALPSARLGVAADCLLCWAGRECPARSPARLASVT